MIDKTDVTHHIQKYILSILMFQKTARFRDMRPPKTDTNLYSYHLNRLLKSGLVEKTEDGYTLGLEGLVYVDRLSTADASFRRQPKIINLLVVQNHDGGVLIYRREKQPFIDMWTLPSGKLHMDDISLLAAAQREAKEKLGLDNQPMRHAGDCYLRTVRGSDVVTMTLVHVFAFERDDIPMKETMTWAQPHKLHEYELAPCVEEIVARTFFRDPFFFEEFTVEW